jgi:predicted transcriptional regulator
MDTEVYSWRVSRELKSDLEQQARIRKTSLSAVLNLAVRDWLKQSAAAVGEDEEQRRLHEAAMKCVGAFAGGNPRRAETARQAIRDRLKRRNAR